MSRVLVTGGTGSFGHAFIESLYLHPFADHPAIRILSRDEEKQRRMAARYPDIEYVIGDIRDPATVHWAMEGVDDVFHAAALKQVPQAERHPGEYVRTNILGTENVCREARERGCRVVVLSTDKAVEPVGVMGASKLLAERIATAYGFNSVRYGNVIGSRGSIIPVWADQMAHGAPLTITDPDMTRFLITLEEAVRLVWTALLEEPDGSVFVRKSPAATVAQLARVFAAGWPTKVIGIRPGERRHEHLVIATENAESLDGYFRIRTDGDYGGLEYSSETAPHLTDEELGVLLGEAPGEYL